MDTCQGDEAGRRWCSEQSQLTELQYPTITSPSSGNSVNQRVGTEQMIDIYIHPSFFCCLSGVGSHNSRLGKVAQTSFSTAALSSSSQGDLKAFPGPLYIYIMYISPVTLESAPGSPLSWLCPENLQREAPQAF